MKNKIHYIGAYKDGTGWGKAAQNYILALDSAGVDVVPSAIKTILMDRHVDIPQRILELEKGDERDCNICIQHILPGMMVYNSAYEKNIGIFMCESSHFKNTDWARYMNCMDEIWICNKGMIKACKESGVTVPLKVIPLCFDISQYSSRYEKLNMPNCVNETFKFYTICETRERKNLRALLTAFHLEFGIEERVSLIIKSMAPLKEAKESFEILGKICDNVKKSIKLYPSLDKYHREVIMPEWLSDYDILRLHKTCDCFILPSYGEAWGIPTFEAMAMGNVAIATNEGGPADFIRDYENGLLISWFDVPAHTNPDEPMLRDLWVGNENWKMVSIDELRKRMRDVFENKELRKEIGKNGIDNAYNYSYQVVGNIMKTILEEE